jgi:hypothetical protein
MFKFEKVNNSFAFSGITAKPQTDKLNDIKARIRSMVKVI